MSANTPLVSVLIPAYNHENYVQETIQSIIDQSYKNIELLIIDDGSKDNTLQKIQAMQELCDKRFVRFMYQTQENSGICITLNHLIAEAKGEYIYIIASDDRAKPKAIEKEVEFLFHKPEYVLVVGDDDFIDRKSQEILWKAPIENSLLDTSKTYAPVLQVNSGVDFSSEAFGDYSNLVIGNYIPNGYLISAKALRTIGGFTPEAPLEDWYIHLQLSKLGKFKYLDEVLFSYRLHNSNTILQTEKMLKMTYLTLKYEDQLVQKEGYERYQKIFKNAHYIRKDKFNLFNLIKFYKLDTYESKKSILEVLGKKFEVRVKKINFFCLILSICLY